MRRTVTALLLLAAVASHAAPVAAQPAAAPHELYQEGVAAYRAKEYPRAAQLFRQAYDAGGRPDLLFNAAQAYRLAGDCAQAADHYRRYLVEVPAAGNRADAEAKLADMERCAAAAEPAAEPAVEPEAEPAAEPEPEPAAEATIGVVEAPRRSRAGLWVAAGGGVALGASLVFWLRARSADRELDELFAEGGTFDGHHEDLERRRDREQTIAIVGASLGVAAVATGLALHWLLPARADGGVTAQVAPAPGGAIVLLGFTP